MAIYTVYLATGAGASVTVEADSKDEAINAAFEEVPHDVCAMCSGMGIGSNYSLDIGEWDYEDIFRHEDEDGDA